MLRWHDSCNQINILLGKEFIITIYKHCERVGIEPITVVSTAERYASAQQRPLLFFLNIFFLFILDNKPGVTVVYLKYRLMILSN